MSYRSRRLPPELWMVVFGIVCFSEDQTTPQFMRARGRLALVCLHWSRIIRAMARIWQVLLLDNRSSVKGAIACVENSRRLPLSIRLSHLEFYGTTSSSARVATFRRCLEALKSVSHRWAALDLRTNWSPTLVKLMRVLASASAESLRSLSLSCSALVLEGSTDELYLTPSTIFAANFPSLRRLDISGVPLRWSDPHNFANLTHLSLRNLPMIACPTLEEYAAFFAAAPRLRTLILKGIGCDIIPENHRPFPLPSIIHLEVIFGTGPYTEASRFYNLLKAFSFPSLASLSVAFLAVPSVHAFVTLPIFVRCESIRIVGRICCGEWLIHLYHSMGLVVNLDLRGAASGFLAALSGPLPTTTGLPCPRLRSLVVSSNQWPHLRRIVLARKRAGIPLDGIGYESKYLEDEDTVDRDCLADFLVVKANVKSIRWIPHVELEGVFDEVLSGFLGHFAVDPVLERPALRAASF
ncbi:hypothetical protein C8R47DRAFT_1288848 [Mycena vitilis]|nr:hypothetical protein C8R47DRAFT_1288848 [Mycena vitilis]